MAHFYLMDGDFLVSAGSAPDGMEPEGAVLGAPPGFFGADLPPHAGARWHVAQQCWQDCRTTLERRDQAHFAVLASRHAAYPPLSDLGDALYWQSRGDDTKMQTYLARCAEVKAMYPKQIN